MAKYKINPHTGKLDRVDDASKDLNENDIIDKAEELDDGLGNTATALDVKDQFHTLVLYMEKECA